VPLTEKVTFQRAIEKSNLVQVPKLIRWQFKLESNQVLKVSIDVLSLGRDSQFFYAKMGKDGRIRIPKDTVRVLQGEETSLANYIMEITLEPT
jgi:hypothetical protein